MPEATASPTLLRPLAVPNMENTAQYDWILLVLAGSILAGGFWMLFSNLIGVNKKMK